jgi:monoamine oxidase
LIDWLAEKRIGCGYACPSKDELLELKKFFELKKYGIYFAGEHTCAPYIGYMEGALQSGCIAAADIRDHPWTDELDALPKRSTPES